MISRKVAITNRLGLHARASSKLVQLANKFNCTIFIEKDRKRANAKSLMSVMMLSAKNGSMIEIIADGIDEIKAAKALIDLISSKFGESE